MGVRGEIIGVNSLQLIPTIDGEPSYHSVGGQWEQPKRHEGCIGHLYWEATIDTGDAEVPWKGLE